MIPLQVLRNELRLGNVTKDDDLIIRYEAGAVAYLERESGLFLGEPTTFVQPWAGEPLRWKPSGAVVLEHRYTAAEPWVVMDAAAYLVTGRVIEPVGYHGAWRYATLWQATYPIGFPAGEEPPEVREAVIMLVQHRYESHTKGQLGVVPQELSEMVRRMIHGLRSLV